MEGKADDAVTDDVTDEEGEAALRRVGLFVRVADFLATLPHASAQDLRREMLVELVLVYGVPPRFEEDDS